MNTTSDAWQIHLAYLAGRVDALGCARPARIGIDGKSAAGKSTVAAGLADVLRRRGRAVVHVSIDDFHPPGHASRSANDGYSAESYYEEGFQYLRFRELVLAPCAAGGSRDIQPRLWDSFRDEAFSKEVVVMPESGVLVVDGAFIQRPEFDGCWDLTVWLDIDDETMVRRARLRDVKWVGDADEVERRYRRRNIPCHELYERTRTPRERADVVVDNRNIDRPRIVRTRGLGEPDGGS